MKIQDIFFIIILAFFLVKMRPTWLIGAGIVSLVIAMPLFMFEIFFTAQRMVYYSFFLLLLGSFLLLFKKVKTKQ